MEGVIIRELRREDCKSLKEMSQELANSFNMQDGPLLTADDFERYGFDSPHPWYYAYVAEFNNGLIGHAIYFDAFSTWRGRSIILEEFYVKPEFRNKGVGNLLYQAVAKKAKDTGCCRLDYLVVKWNPAVDFYKRRGAVDVTEEKQWHVFRVDAKDL